MALELVLIPVTVAVYATNVPSSVLGTATPATEGFAFQNVSFATVDGVRQSGWYIASRNGAAIVLLHGAGSTWTSVLGQAAVLARHGYGVSMVDARGHGRSGGVAMVLGLEGNCDVSAAVTWLEARSGVPAGRIAAVGMSIGGEEAIGAADRHIRAVVAKGALWRGSMDIAWLPSNLEGLVERAMNTVQTAVADLRTSAPVPTSLRAALVATAPRPVLLIAGKPELRGDRYCRDALPGNVQLWELPDTPHIGGLGTHPSEWTARVTTFLDRALGS